MSSNYSRDALGRIKGLFAPGIVDAEMEYDETGRIVELKNFGETFNSIVYDSNGNRLSLTSSDGTKYGTYDNQDRLLT